MSLPLQLGWFIDPVPKSLPTWLIALGLEAMFIGVVWQVTQETSQFDQLGPMERLFGVCGLGLGYFFITLSVLTTAYDLYAAFLFLVFRGVEGVAAVHIFAKIRDFLRGDGISGDFTKRARHLLVVFFVIALGSYLILKGLVSRPTIGGFWYDVHLVYTVMTAVLAFLAVRWRYRDVSADLNTGIISGLALGIAGAQIFDFSLPADVLITVAGSVMYSAGFWVAAVLLFGTTVISGTNSTTCTNCKTDVPDQQQANFCPNCGHAL